MKRFLPLLMLAACSPFLPVEERVLVEPGAEVAEADAGSSAGPGAEPDAGPGRSSSLRGGCFERPVSIGSFPTSGRPHLQVQAMAAFEHGWIVAMSGNEAGQRLLFLDHLGAVIANEEAPFVVNELFVEGSHLIILASYWGVRFDLGPLGVTKRFEQSEFLGREGLGPTSRAEGVLASVRIAGGARVLTHHYDTAASRSRLRLTDLTLDDTRASGLRQQTGELGERAPIEPFASDRIVLGPERRGGDRLWVFHHYRMRLSAIQLGVTGLPNVIPVHVEAEHPWELSRPWNAFDTLTDDHQAALTTEPDGGVTIRELPTGPVAPTPRPLAIGRVLSEMPTVHELSDGRLLVATPDQLSFYDRSTGLEVGPPEQLSTRLWPRPVAVMSRPGVVAFVSVEGAGRDQLTFRCIPLPSR